MLSSKQKRTFKIFLDSNNTESYDGSLFNATYYVDLTHIIFQDEDFDKQYKMSFNFQSIFNTTAISGFDPKPIYSLHIDMGKGLNIFQYRQVKNPSGLLQISNYVDGANNYYGFNTKETDNLPVLVQNIRNMNMITLNVINTTTNSTLSGINAGTMNYICVLTFEEI